MTRKQLNQYVFNHFLRQNVFRFMLFMASFCTQALTTIAANDEVVITVERNVTIEKREASGPLSLDVDLGAFHPKTRVRCKLQIENATDTQFDFTQLETGCKCAVIIPQQGSIIPGERFTFTMELKIPTTSAEASGKASFIAFDNRVLQFIANVKYSIAGVVGFSDSMLAVRVPKGAAEYRVSIPIYLGPLTKKELVNIEVPDVLQGIDFKVDVEKKLVLMTVPESALSDGRLVGNLAISNIENGSTDGILIDIDLSESIAVYPSSILFYPENEDLDGKLIGKILVNDANQDKISPSPIAATFKLHGMPVEASVVYNKGTATFYRLLLPRQSIPEDRSRLVLDCDLIGKQSKRSVQVPFRVEHHAIPLSEARKKK